MALLESGFPKVFRYGVQKQLGVVPFKDVHFEDYPENQRLFPLLCCWLRAFLEARGRRHRGDDGSLLEYLGVLGTFQLVFKFSGLISTSHYVWCDMIFSINHARIFQCALRAAYTNHQTQLVIHVAKND